MDPEPTTPTEVVYTMGRSGRDASTYCKELDALIGFLPHLAPGDYWIRRCLAPRVPGGYREPISAVDWGVVRVDADGGFILRSTAEPGPRPAFYDDHVEGRFQILDHVSGTGRNP